MGEFGTKTEGIKTQHKANFNKEQQQPIQCE